jgi:hypothetical protein
MKLSSRIVTVTAMVAMLACTGTPAFGAGSERTDTPARWSLVATQASTNDDADRSLQNIEADERGYIVVTPGDAIKTSLGVFYPTGEIRDDTIVVIADSDGSLPGNLTEAELKSAASLRAPSEDSPSVRTDDVTVGSTTARLAGAYSANSTGWSSPYNGGSLIGFDAASRAGYYFNVLPGTSQVNAGSGLGYYRGYLGSVFGTWSAWYNLGTAADGTPKFATVPWGNVAATTKFRARCSTTSLCGGTFSAPS